MPNMPAGWTGADTTLAQSTDANGQTQVGIRQTKPQAVLNWESFNVGARTKLTFDQQGNSSWVALNRVTGVAGQTVLPSQILGQIKADGHVYVINPNGIIFGGNAQVNVGSLIAAAADISPNQFTNSGIFSPFDGASYTPSFKATGGKVTVEAGALIATRAPSSVTAGGGYVLMIGSEVSNHGAISTPKGQTILAAGNDFVLRRGFSTDTNAVSTTRGIEIVTGTQASDGTWTPGGGTVANHGLILAQQGDITLAGRTLLQEGALLATTSVNNRGTIHLLNAASDTSSSVTLGKNALTAILPEMDSTETALDSQRDGLIAASEVANAARGAIVPGMFDNLSLLADRQDQSRVEIVSGGIVTFKGGSYTAAQGGQIAVSAKERIVTETGATLDVSGVRNVALAMSANNMQVNIQGNELRDSPQNRDGSLLKNENVWVDIRTLTLVPKGTGGYDADRYYTKGGLLEVGGYLANTAHGIGEWTAVGGTITLSANEVIAQKGSRFDLSGGSLDFAGGYIRSTNLIGSDGRRYSIDDAPSDMEFANFAGGFRRTHNIQGQEDKRLTEIWTTVFDRGRTSLRWEDGYSVGRDAGRLILSAPTGIFEADIIADVVQGQRQSGKRPNGVTDGYKATQTIVAQAATLATGNYNYDGRFGVHDTDVRIGDIADITAGLDLSGVLPGDRSQTLWLNADRLSVMKLGGLDLATAGKVTINGKLTLAVGGALDIIAPVVDLAADVTAHSGRISVSNVFKSATSTAAAIGLAIDGKSNVTLHSGVTLDVTGLWVNAQSNPQDPNKAAFINGGAVRLESTGDVATQKGSLIDVSSGAFVATNGKLTGGRGGDVALIADRTLTGNTQLGSLTLDGDIRAYGMAGGGTLSVESGPGISIGGKILRNNGQLAAGEEAPIDLVLMQDILVRKGEALPADYHYTRSIALVGEEIGGRPTSPSVPIVLASDWTVPWPFEGGYNVMVDGVSYDVRGNSTGTSGGVRYYDPDIRDWVQVSPTFRAGSVITVIQDAENAFPKNYIVPSAFPDGIPVVPTQVTLSVGVAAPMDVTFSAGSTILAGATVTNGVAVKPLLNLDTSLFRSGFSNYSAYGHNGIAVAAGAKLAVETPVYRIPANAYSLPTGSTVTKAFDLWTPPVYLDSPSAAEITQRAGGDLTLRSDGQIIVATGSVVGVDPERTITIRGGGSKQITVDGTLNAWGGTISIDALINADIFASRASGSARDQSIWIGDHAVLDVAGRAVTARDRLGRTYGYVQAGGTISIGGGGLDWEQSGEAKAPDLFVIIRPGAVLDASGTSTVLDLPLNTSMERSSSPFAVASDGGTIILKSNHGLYLDGSLRAAAGGADAAGGTLALALDTPLYDTSVAGGIDSELRVARDFVIAQQQGSSPLGSDARPGRGDPTLRYGAARLGVDKLGAGGFGNLSLLSTGLISFDGDVSVALAQSLRLYGYAYALTENVNANTHIALAAPHVFLAGATRHLDGGLNTILPTVTNAMAGFSTRPTDAVFMVSADLIDIRDQVGFGAFGIINGLQIDRRGFVDVDLVSRGDVRLLQNDGPTAGDATFPIAAAAYGAARTMLRGPGDVTVTAAQVYPATGAFGSIQAAETLTIRRYVDVPALPLSAFGRLLLDGKVIEQGGIVRAPGGMVQIGDTAGQVRLLPGSITSASLDGLLVPYGGTADGLDWLYNGTKTAFLSITGRRDHTQIRLDRTDAGVVLSGGQIDVQGGALVDLRGGGELTGAGFISGRGGSVNVLKYALADANPALSYSRSGNDVYAIVPSFAGGYAPIAPEAGAGNPSIGRQITIPAGVPGLPAGIYTLLPSTYALLPGAFRVELGATISPASNYVMPTASGSYRASGYLGVANTSLRDSLPTQIVLSSADTVRQHATYNETSYSQFATTRASELGWPRPFLPGDGKNLVLAFTAAAATAPSALSFNGEALFAGADGGFAGYTSLLGKDSGARLEILAVSSQKTAGFISLADSALSAIGAPRLVVGGRLLPSSFVTEGFADSIVTVMSNGGSVVVRSGAALSAGEVLLATGTGGSITIEQGAKVSMLGHGPTSFDSSSGYLFQSSFSTLAVSNGLLEFLPSTAPAGSGGGIVIGGCLTVCSGETQLFAEGSIALVSGGTVTIDPAARYGARVLQFGVSSVNIGTEAALANAGAAGLLPSGMAFNQQIFDRLIAGNQGAGIPKLESLVLSANQSVNFFGTVDLSTIDPLTDRSNIAQLVLNAPAIYGYGSAADVATLTTASLVWSGIRANEQGVNMPGTSLPPGAIIPGGAGTGSGTLNLVADRVTFGYGERMRVDNQVTVDRLALGFGTVNITAAQRIEGNNKGTLSVYQSKNGDVFSGGNLNLTTPLLSGGAGSVLSINAGGAFNVVAPAGADLAAIQSDVLGATLNLKGGIIHLDTAIVLPSGRLTLTADGDVMLDSRSRIDMSGRAVRMFDVTKYSWGGDVAIESADGNVLQAGGAVINLSAEHNKAGSLSVTALGDTAGRIDLAGTVRGTATGSTVAGGNVLPWLSGNVELRGQTIADFAGLNKRLTTGGVFGERVFQIKQGDLVIGHELRANVVDISVDGGGLTVVGTIDASGERVGTIRLAARDGLMLGATARLDAHGTVLRVDSDGDPIDAPNRAIVELTSKAGRVTLQSGATIDLRAADSVSRGTLTINARRLSETSGNIDIDAGGSYDIRGARSIAVNGFWTYSPTDADGTIVQNNSGAAPVAADGKLGLDQVHLRSESFMTAALSNADLLTRLGGLSRYSDAFHLRPGVEIASAAPDGKLTVKGDLNLSGYRYQSLNPNTQLTGIYGSGEPGALVIRAGSNLDIKGSINDGFAPPPATPEDNLGWIINETILLNGVPATRDATFTPPFDNDLGGSFFTFPGGDLMTGVLMEIYVQSGSITDDLQTYGPGDVIPGYLMGTITVTAGTVITAADPASAQIVLNGPEAGHKLWAVAPMLAQGSQSWDIRLGSGADLHAANQRALQAASKLAGQGNMTLSDRHVLAGTSNEIFSVIRTGTGDLDLFVGGAYTQNSLYGVYTAGTQSTPVLKSDGSNSYNLPRGTLYDGFIVGTIGGNDYEPLVTGNNYQAWYPEHGGNLSIRVNGDMKGSIVGWGGGAPRGTNSSYVGNWLWSQGGVGDTAWWINFGTYARDAGNQQLLVAGFSGLGTLGGGNVSLKIGGDAGVIETRGSQTAPASSGLDIAIGSTGRLRDDGVVVKTGGGDLSITVAGGLNALHPVLNASSISQSAAGVVPMLNDLTGVITNLRGTVDLAARSIGRIDLTYGTVSTTDPRAPDPLDPNKGLSSGGFTILPGDTTVNLATRGDLVIGMTADPGPLDQLNVSASGNGRFSLYRAATALDAISAGGNLTPFKGSAATGSNRNNYDPVNGSAPASLGLASLSGSVYLDGSVTLYPASRGRLDLLAARSIYGAGGGLNMGGGDAEARYGSILHPRMADAPQINPETNLHAGDPDPIRLYAVGGDLLDVASGYRFIIADQNYSETIAAKPVWARAGRDLVNVTVVALNNDIDDVSLLSAGRDILYANAQVGGPGLLDIAASRNIYQADRGQITSIGALVPGDTRSGASILMQAGVGTSPDYAALASRYLDPANLAVTGTLLADQPGKVAKTYEKELAYWLKQRLGFTGTAEEARAYFDGLDNDQRGVFLRQVYFAELTAAGREYNDTQSPRYRNYIRGREAIAALFPDKDANGNVIQRSGDITMFSTRSGDDVKDGSVRTLFGGDIQMLAPGGRVVVGVEGVVPGAEAGVITQGGGDIQMFSKGSLLLGLSRIMTVFGDDIIAWSNEGDINAGRGAKTTIGYTPAKRVQDNYGTVTLSPSAPTSGAGISARSSIPGIPSGDVDLIAPIGTIDIGEAGVSGRNINVAALQIINAANITAQGNTTGVPTVQAPSIAAALSTSNATAATQQTATPQTSSNAQPSVIIVEVLGYGGGNGESTDEELQTRRTRTEQQPYNSNSRLQVIGLGPLTEQQKAQLADDERSALSE